MTEQMRQGTEFVAEIPAKAGKVVGMALLSGTGRIVIACQFGIYELIEAAHPEPRKIREILNLIPGE